MYGTGGLFVRCGSALVLVLLLILVLILVPGLIGSTSFMIIPSGAIAIAVAYLFFKKGRKKEEAE